jgi:hypothetical protein
MPRPPTSSRRRPVSPSSTRTSPSPGRLAEDRDRLAGWEAFSQDGQVYAGLGHPPGDSAIVTVDVPGAEQKLRLAGVRAAVRAGRVRASFHVYSTEADVDMALTALAA